MMASIVVRKIIAVFSFFPLIFSLISPLIFPTHCHSQRAHTARKKRDAAAPLLTIIHPPPQALPPTRLAMPLTAPPPTRRWTSTTALCSSATPCWWNKSCHCCSAVPCICSVTAARTSNVWWTFARLPRATRARLCFRRFPSFATNWRRAWRASPVWRTIAARMIVSRTLWPFSARRKGTTMAVPVRRMRRRERMCRFMWIWVSSPHHSPCPTALCTKVIPECI